jgi:hypothetical protein
MNYNVSYFICKQCYKYKYSSDELQYKNMCYPLYGLNCNFSGYDLCFECDQKYSKDELIDAKFIKDDNMCKKSVITEKKIAENIKQGPHKIILDVPANGDLINIKFELEFTGDYNILKDDFEYTIFDSVDLIINGESINKIYYYDIYKCDKVNKNIILKDLENKKLTIELPFSFDEISPLYCQNFDANDKIQLRFDFGYNYFMRDENKNKIEWINPKIIYTYLAPGYVSKCKSLEMSDIIQHQTDGEEQLEQNIINVSGSEFSSSHYLHFNHQVTEINFGIFCKGKKKYLEFLECVKDVQIKFDGCDLYHNVISGDSIKQNGNIYTIKFENPINMTFIRSAKLFLKFKSDAFKNIELSNIYVWISADSHNKILYNSDLKKYCKYILYCCCGGYNIKIFDDRKKVDNVNIFDNNLVSL